MTRHAKLLAGTALSALLAAAPAAMAAEADMLNSATAGATILAQTDTPPADEELLKKQPPAEETAPAAEPAPQAEPAPEPEAQPAPEPEAKPAPEPEAQPTPEPEAQPAPEPEAQPAPEPEAQPAPEPEAQPAPEPEAQPAPEPEAQPAPEAELMDGGEEPEHLRGGISRGQRGFVSVVGHGDLRAILRHWRANEKSGCSRRKYW